VLSRLQVRLGSSHTSPCWLFETPWCQKQTDNIKGTPKSVLLQVQMIGSFFDFGQIVELQDHVFVLSWPRQEQRVAGNAPTMMQF
jgi:hypothetical protein